MSLKATNNAMATARTIILDEDLVTYVLDGLQPSYKSFQTALSMRPSLVSFEELHVLLLTEEDLIQRTQEPASPPKAFYKSKEKGKNKSNFKSKSKKNSTTTMSTRNSSTTPNSSSPSVTTDHHYTPPPAKLLFFSPLHHPSIPTLVNFVIRMVMLQELAREDKVMHSTQQSTAPPMVCLLSLLMIGLIVHVS